MKPEHYVESLKLMEKYWPDRIKHSTHVGSWMVSIGKGIFETVHLWEYGELYIIHNMKNLLSSNVGVLIQSLQIILFKHDRTKQKAFD